METVFALCAILLLGFNLLSIVLAGWRLTRPDAENDLVRQKPPVSLVVPLRGVENFTPLTLSRAFELNWPDYELLFCVADEFDPVIEEVRKAQAAFPSVSMQLLIGDDRISANPKLNNCVKGWRAARHEWVILADSNVLMPKSYIATMMSAWRQDSGLVCSPPLGSRPAGFWAHVECAFLNGSQGRWQYAAEAIGMGFAQGKSMLWNKPFLEDNGGIRALAAEIAEDAASTKLVRNTGRKVHLVCAPFEQGSPLVRHTIFAALLIASAPAAIAAPTPKDQLLVPPKDAAHYVVISTAGKHGDEYVWKLPDGRTAFRQSILLRGLIFEVDETFRFGPDNMPSEIVIRGVTPSGDAAGLHR